MLSGSRHNTSQCAAVYCGFPVGLTIFQREQEAPKLRGTDLAASRRVLLTGGKHGDKEHITKRRTCF